MGLNPQLAIMMSGIATIVLPAHRRRARCRATSARRPRSSAASPRSGPRAATPPRSPARSSSPALVLAARRRAHPLPRLRGAAQGAAAGGHRRRRHADRLQPRPGGRQHLLAAGPVGRAGHDDLHDRRAPSAFRGFIGRIAVFLAPDLRLPRCRGCSTRPSARSPPCSAAPPRPPTHLRWDTSTASAAPHWFGFPPQTVDRRRRQGGRRAGTARPSRSPRSCWCCRPSSRSSPRTPATSRRSPR